METIISTIIENFDDMTQAEQYLALMILRDYYLSTMV